MNKIVIITPMKDEKIHITTLFESLETSSIRISLWIIVDDNSVDGSGEIVNNFSKKTKNIDRIIICKSKLKNSNYQLGEKYSSVVSIGIKKLNEIVFDENFYYDYIGILDADNRITNNYYEKLIDKFNMLPKLGLASGVMSYNIDNNEVVKKETARFARGSIRLWRKGCFDNTGYIICKSADAVTSAMAWTSGWHSQSFKDAIVYSREVGSKADPLYYGKAAYYLYYPLYFIVIKCLYWLLLGRFNTAKNYFLGYFRGVTNRKRANINNSIKWYFRLIILHIILENIIVIHNNIQIACIFNQKFE